MKNIIKCLLLMLLSINISKGQTIKEAGDTVRTQFCGSTPEFSKKMYDARTKLRNGQVNDLPSPYKYVLQDSFPAANIVRCGMFRVYYEDFTSTADGFADPFFGTARRNTMCAVLGYVESVIDINDTIDIFVSRSFSASNHYVGTGATLASAGSEYPPNWDTTPGIYNGYAFDHITTGIDPDATTYDMNVNVNFDRVWSTASGSYVNVSYYNNHSSLAPGSCLYDLYSVLLHEITHGMGWVSMITEDITTGRPAINGNNGLLFNHAYSRFDSTFLYKGDILSGTFTKLLDTSDTIPRIDSMINTISNPLRANDIWLYNNTAPLNQPMYSGDFFGYPISAPSLVTHLNFNYYSMVGMSQFSPGYQDKYVMGPFFDKNEMRRTWTYPEMRALLNLGYSLNPAFSSATSLNGTDTNNNLLVNNSPPYRTDPSTLVTTTNNNPAFADNPTLDTTFTNNNTPGSPSLSQLTINISGLNVADDESNTISIMPNGLFGIRGVSSGGNNHNLLNINSARTSVVYTPVPGFNGIAQFGFYLWDGHERGAFKTYTINVVRGSYSPSAGENLAVNGNFEDGTEVRDTANLSKINTGAEPNMEGVYFAGTTLSGGHPYNYIQNWWTYGGGNVVSNSYLACGIFISPASFPWFGSVQASNGWAGATGHHPLPMIDTVPNERYAKSQNGPLGDPYFINLKDTLKPYSYYIIDLDIAFSQNSSAANNPGDPFSTVIEFSGSPVISPSVLPIFQSNSINGTIDSVLTNNRQRRWQHIRDTIQYCQEDPCFTVTIQTNVFQNHIDNFSIVEMANPPLITVVEVSSDTNNVCPGDLVNLHAEPNSNSCSIEYVWMPGNLLGQNLSINPSVTTTYTVTATDLLDTTSHITDTITIFITPLNTQATASSYSICQGANTTLTATGATSYLWSPGGSTSNPLTVSPAVTTSYVVTGTTGSCSSMDTVLITVKPLPSVTVPSSSTVCPGATIPATSFSSTPSGATYTWTNSNTAIGLGASGSGNISSFTATNSGSSNVSGTITVTPTLNGCVGTASTYTITVKPNPAVGVPLSFSTCPGSTVSATSFFSTPSGATYTWTNSNTAIGLGASGSGNISAFTATNTGTTNISGAISVTPTLNSCVGSASTYTITVKPKPIATVPSSSTVCPGTVISATSFSSTPSGATYTWTNSNTAIGLGTSGSGNVAAFTAANSGNSNISGTISVIPTLNGCVGTASTYTITVIPNPSATVPSSSTVCPGTVISATSFSSTPSGAIYTWTNSNTAIGLGASGSGNIASFTTTNTSTANIAGTISVTPTLNGCVGTASTYTITVKPNPTVTVSDITVCAGSTVPASSFMSTPTGATYTWTNSNTAIGLAASGSGNYSAFAATNTGASPISGTITVTPTLSGCVGAASTYTITVNPACSSAVYVISTGAGNTSYTSGATTISSATVNVLDDITVSGTAYLTITSPDFRLAANKKITISNGATLKVDRSWLHACSSCGLMWDGIYVEKGGTLIVMGGSVVEDAINAVITTNTGAGTIPNYTITQTTFNKNLTAIKIQTNANNMSSNLIENTIITCRTLPTPTSGAWATNFNNLKTALSTNVLTSYPATTTLLGGRSNIGIEMIGLSHATTYTKVGNPTSGYTNMCIFDNLYYGVKLTGSRCDIKNCSFINLTGNQLAAGRDEPTPDPFGIGVWAPVQASVTYTDLVLGGSGTNDKNIFYDCYRAVELNNYYTLTATRNKMTCSSTPTTFPTSGSTKAGIGIYLKDMKELVLIKGDTSCPVTNWATGIYLTRNTVSTGTLNPSITIDGNTISANASGYCNQAILMTDIASITSPAVQIQVKNNAIYDVKNGIKASNIKNNFIVYNNDTIALRYTSGSTICHGIMLESCDKAEVKKNTIYSLRGTYGTTDNWSIRGIYAKNSTNNAIWCNTLSSLGQCLVFEGGCTSTGGSYGIFANDMSNCRTGYMIRTSGVIGQQGSSTVPSSNHWINSGLNFTDGHTNVVSSVPGLSNLYCLASGTSNPTLNSGATPYTNPGTIALATGSELNCGTISLPSGLAVTGSSQVRSMDAMEDYTLQLRELLLNSLANAGTFASDDWMMQNYIYNEVRTNIDLQSDSVLNHFYTNNLSSSFGIIASINEEIENLNYSQAAVLNNSLNPTNTIVQNHQNFNSIYLSHMDSSTIYTAGEVNQLFSIAQQCGVIGGNAVYQSRNLIMSIENRVIDFGDSCDYINNVSYVRSQEISKEVSKIRLYPNPSTGKINLECKLQETEIGMLRIYNLTGNLVGSYKLASGSQVEIINAEKLNPGMYLYEVIVNGRQVQIDKLIIIK